MNGVDTIQAFAQDVGEDIPAIALTGDIRSEVLGAIARQEVRIATEPANADQFLHLVRRQHTEMVAEEGLKMLLALSGGIFAL
jgi:CheY-like chemotaxis protein